MAQSTFLNTFASLKCQSGGRRTPKILTHWKVRLLLLLLLLLTVRQRGPSRPGCHALCPGYPPLSPAGCFDCFGTLPSPPPSPPRVAYVAHGGNEDKSGSISLRALRETVRRFGLAVDVDALVAEFDTNDDGKYDHGDWVVFVVGVWLSPWWVVVGCSCFSVDPPCCCCFVGTRCCCLVCVRSCLTCELIYDRPLSARSI